MNAGYFCVVTSETYRLNESDLDAVVAEAREADYIVTFEYRKISYSPETVIDFVGEYFACEKEFGVIIQDEDDEKIVFEVVRHD